MHYSPWRQPDGRHRPAHRPLPVQSHGETGHGSRPSTRDDRTPAENGGPLRPGGKHGEGDAGGTVGQCRPGGFHQVLDRSQRDTGASWETGGEAGWNLSDGQSMLEASLSGTYAGRGQVGD